jgi:hypothetical protein
MHWCQKWVVLHIHRILDSISLMYSCDAVGGKDGHKKALERKLECFQFWGVCIRNLANVSLLRLSPSWSGGPCVCLRTGWPKFKTYPCHLLTLLATSNVKIIWHLADTNVILCRINIIQFDGNNDFDLTALFAYEKFTDYIFNLKWGCYFFP